MKSRINFSIATLIALFMLTACGQKNSSDSQVLVKVNDDEITVHQLNMEMAQTPDGDKINKKILLGNLVDRELLAEAAKNEKLDQSPDVLQETERARIQIAARAYLQSKMKKVNPPTVMDVDDFYRSHPDFFSERKLYALDELAIPTSAYNEELKAVIDNAIGLNGIATWLDSHHIAYEHSNLSRTGADLSQSVLAMIKPMEKGHIFIARENDRALIIQIMDVHPSPVNRDTAVPQIQRYLMNQKSAVVADAELQQLRSSAKIEYLNQALKPDSGSSASTQPRTAPKSGASASSRQADVDRAAAALR